VCAGTKPIERAAADLEYFANLPQAPPTGHVYGKVERSVRDGVDIAGIPMSGLSVTLSSDSRRMTAATDSEGNLDLHVPPGVYTIEPVVPPTIRVSGVPRRVSVAAGSCAPVSFRLISNGRIEGRVMLEDGSGVPRASVNVIPIDLPERGGHPTIAPSSATDESGRFTVEPVLPGRYVVAVNARHGPRLFSPFLPTYSPAGARSDARAIDLGDGERVTDVTIVVSPLVETTVSGFLTFDDGSPVVNGAVRIAPVDYKSMITATATTDSTGAFRLRALTGVNYLISGSIRISNRLRRTEAEVFVDEQKEDLRLSIRP
jgi:hypothetical protein